MITVYIDTFTPCLKMISTGEIYDTEVVRIKRKSFLSKFNKKTGWYVNWGKLVANNEVYALVLKGSMDIQGLIALTPDPIAQAVYIQWACTAPHNNKQKGKQKYEGVGGHLFAIAAKRSLECGFGGAVYGDASSPRLLKHYMETLHAFPIPSRTAYRCFVDEAAAAEIMEVYTYEWNDEEY